MDGNYKENERSIPSQSRVYFMNQKKELINHCSLI